MIDHRGSPGTAAVPEGKQFECATVTCAHCQTIVILNPDRSRARGYCAKCDHYVCDNPACNLTCRPIKALIEDFIKDGAQLLSAAAADPAVSAPA